MKKQGIPLASVRGRDDKRLAILYKTEMAEKAGV